jgi:hypothetical protein
MAPFFVDCCVIGQGNQSILLAGDNSGGAGYLDLLPHLTSVIGPVGQYRLARSQMGTQQARSLRAVAALACGQGHGTTAALGIITQMQFRAQSATAAAKGLSTGSVFFSRPPPLGAPARPSNRPAANASL